MKVAISSSDKHLEAPVSPVFGRCADFLLVDSETMQFTALPNPAVGASGGAGIQAAQYIVQQGAEAVASGNVGPNAMQVLLAAGIAVYSREWHRPAGRRGSQGGSTARGEPTDRQ